MDLIMNLAKAKRVAMRKAVEKDKWQPVVAMAGGYVVPSNDELEYECIGAEIVAAYGPAGEDVPAMPVWC
jgi:hypothetical protein